jgi:hypothetical protein
MSEIDYTEIRDGEIRGKICELMSDMLDNPDECGLYPTSEFMWKMESYVLPLYEALGVAYGMISTEKGYCPQCGDGSGAYYDNYGECCQCQWCYEADRIKEALDKVKVAQ